MMKAVYGNSGKLAVLLTSILVALLAACAESAPAPVEDAAADLPASPTLDRIREAGVVRVGGAVALPWMGQDPQTDEFFGPAVYIGEQIGEALGVEVEWVPETWDVIVAAVQSGKVDIAVAPMYMTAGRLEVVDMSPWDIDGYCYFTAKSNTHLNTLDDLNDPDVRISSFVGSSTTEHLPKKYPLATYNIRTALAGEIAPHLDVLAGRADVVPVDGSLKQVFELEFPDYKLFPDDCQQNPDISTPIGAAYEKGDVGFKVFLEDLFVEIQPEIEAQIVKFSDPDFMRPGLDLGVEE